MINENNNEITWIPLVGYELTHEINKLGQIRGENKRIMGQPICNGYPTVHIRIKGRREKLYVHRLLGQHFIPNPENKKTINHKDGNKKNNSLDNLEWATQAENNRHKYDTGLHITKKRSESPSSKLVLNTANGIYYGCSIEAAETIGVHPHTFRSWLRGDAKNKSSFIYV